MQNDDYDIGYGHQCAGARTQIRVTWYAHTAQYVEAHIQSHMRLTEVIFRC